MSMILVLSMVFSILLATSTTANTTRCNHSSYTDYYDTTLYAQGEVCRRKHFYWRICDDCKEKIDYIEGPWKYYHNYGSKQYVGEVTQDNNGMVRSRAKYVETCMGWGCDKKRYSYGPWGPWK